MEQNSLPYISTLNPLRGIAAILVVVAHCNFVVKPFLLAHTKFLQSAMMSVDFFFVLSGFIMSYVYHGHFNRKVTSANFRHFVGARFARVYPLHFVTTIWAFICSFFILRFANAIDPASIGEYNLKALPACIFLLNGFPLFPTFPLNVPSWSLSTEWWVYMIFPFIAPVIFSLKPVGKLVAILIVAIFYSTVVFYGPSSGPVYQYLADHLQSMVPFNAILKCVAGFVLGMLLYTLYRQKFGYFIIKRDWFFVLILFALILAMHFGITKILIVACFALIILSASYNNGRVKHLFDRKAFQHIGNWSFSIYLVHYPLIFMYFIFRLRSDPSYLAESIFLKEQNFMAGLVLCMIILALTMLVSAFTWRFIEMPARKYFNSLFSNYYLKTRNT